MPRNNGIYAPPPSTWFPAVDGNPASPEDWNSLLSDIASALTQSISKDGQTQITGDLNFGGNQAQNLRAPSSNSEALRRAQIIKGADIEAAATIAIPDEGAVFVITGDAQIEAISGGFSGRIVVLKFSEDLVIKNSASIICPGGRDYFAAQGGMAIIVKVDTSVWQLFSTGSGYSFEVGDFLDTIRTPDASWLKRDGASYARGDYPDLAALIPPTPPGFDWEVLALPVGVLTSRQRMSPGRAPGEVLLIAGQSSLEGYSLHATSDSGVSWELISQSAIAGDSPISQCAYGNGVLVRSVSSISGQNGWVRYSNNDGASWSQANVLSGSRIEGLIWSERLGLFIAVGGSGKISTSPDGATWTARASTGIAFYAVFEIDDTLIAVGGGANATIYTSVDGVVWQERDIPTGAITLYVAGKMGDYWFVVGDSNNAWYTLDFINWINGGQVFTGGGSIGFGAQTSELAVFARGASSAGFTNTGTSWLSDASPSGISLYDCFADPLNSNRFLFSTGGANLVRGVLTVDSDTFHVPADNPVNGWIKAL